MEGEMKRGNEKIKILKDEGRSEARSTMSGCDHQRNSVWVIRYQSHQQAFKSFGGLKAVCVCVFTNEVIPTVADLRAAEKSLQWSAAARHICKIDDCNEIFFRILVFQLVERLGTVLHHSPLIPKDFCGICGNPPLPPLPRCPRFFSTTHLQSQRNKT